MTPGITGACKYPVIKSERMSGLDMIESKKEKETKCIFVYNKITETVGSRAVSKLTSSDSQG